jgi:hypothetical protein
MAVISVPLGNMPVLARLASEVAFESLRLRLGASDDLHPWSPLVIVIWTREL